MALSKGVWAPDCNVGGRGSDAVRDRQRTISDEHVVKGT